MAADAADSLALRFRTANVELEQHLPPRSWATPDGCTRSSPTLLANAAKFTPAGGKVTVRADSTDSDAVLEVTDTGPGIPETERPLVWERFYRGSSGRLADGSGIGLAVVKELVDAHGGRISVDDTPGGGTRFIVHLPQTATPA